jgi:ribosomal protein L3
MYYGIEHFTFSESVYFVDVTVTTVGFGDNGTLPVYNAKNSRSYNDSRKSPRHALCNHWNHLTRSSNLFNPYNRR